MHENAKELEMLENEYFPLPESESSPPKDTSDSESSEDDNDVLPLRSGKKRVTFSRKKISAWLRKIFPSPLLLRKFFWDKQNLCLSIFLKGRAIVLQLSEFWINRKVSYMFYLIVLIKKWQQNLFRITKCRRKLSETTTTRPEKFAPFPETKIGIRWSRRQTLFQFHWTPPPLLFTLLPACPPSPFLRYRPCSSPPKESWLLQLWLHTLPHKGAVRLPLTIWKTSQFSGSQIYR